MQFKALQKIKVLKNSAVLSIEIALDETDIIQNLLSMPKNVSVTIDADDSMTDVIQPWLRRRIMGMIQKYIVTQDLPMTIKDSIRKSIQDQFFNQTGIEIISLSDCSKFDAMEFSDWILDRAMEFDFLPEMPWELSCDRNKLIESAFRHNCCTVCGTPAIHTHHLVPIGIGADRTDGSDIDDKVCRLCEAHHREAHEHGVNAFLVKYDLQFVTVTKRELVGRGVFK